MLQGLNTPGGFQFFAGTTDHGATVVAGIVHSLKLIAQLVQLVELGAQARLQLQRDVPEPDTDWGHTSDSIALDLAFKLNAERLVLVKSCAIDSALSFAQLGQSGVVDPDFAARSDGAAFPIEVLNKGNLARMRSLLLGVDRRLGD